MRASIAIIGAGFSGTLTAIHLAQGATTEKALDIYLIEARGIFGPGLAYSPPSDRFKLNVPAGAMGAFADDPGGFYRWLQERDPNASPQDFAPRIMYGHYLSDLLGHVSTQPNEHALHRIHDEVVEITREAGPDGFTITLESGPVISVDACVVATGNLMKPSSGPGLHFRQPFDPRSYSDISSSANIFILGSGLTAVDVIVECEARGCRGNYTVVSRHGRFPLPHTRPSTGEATNLPPNWEKRGSVRDIVSTIRAEARRIGSSQPVFEAMRPNIQSMWRHFSDAERKRFLRHARPIWDIHRHRMPAEHGDTLSRLRRERRLDIVAGKLLSASPLEMGDHRGKTAITIAQRGKPQPVTLPYPYDVAFHCIGPEGDITKLNNPLLNSLTAQHLIEPGPLGLGPVRNERDNLPLWLMGPLQRETLWETTAVREIRQQAQEVAAEVHSFLSRTTTSHKQ